MRAPNARAGTNTGAGPAGSTGRTSRTGHLAARAAAAVAALALAAGLAACSSDNQSAESGSAAERQTETGSASGADAGAQGQAPQAVPGQPGQEAPGTGPKAEPLPDPATRSLVQIGEITVRVKEIDEAAASASTIATGGKGLVAGDRRNTDGASSSATLVLRVLPQDFTRVVGELAGLGEEVTRSLRTEDVTEAVVDLDSRIASQQASVTRTRVLLSRAERIADIVAVEGELARREADLAALQARKRALADTVTLATITLNLLGPRAAVTTEENERGFLAGLEAGWNAFTATTVGMLTLFGAVLPFLVVAAVPALVLWLVLRRRRRRGTTPVAAPPAPVPAGAAPAPDAS